MLFVLEIRLHSSDVFIESVECDKLKDTDQKLFFRKLRFHSMLETAIYEIF